MQALKICGIRSAAFAALAAEAQVDYLGFVFAPGSPRRVTPAEAAHIAAALPRRTKRVGVFALSPVADVLAAARAAALDVVQLHDEAWSADDALAVKAEGCEVWALAHGFPPPPGSAGAVADAVLLDGRSGGVKGGTGRRADWSLVAPLKAAGRRVVLAGGISTENIADAAKTGADVIDVNSSLETAPGVKSPERLAALLSAWKPRR